jgi:Holliday junction DNA helicase RuvA
VIGRLRGEVIDRMGPRVVVDVQGVGYVVTVSPTAEVRLGERVDLHIHTQVRDDAIQLFGFREPEERDVFHMLIDVPNIGPVKAMQILATPVRDLIALVARRDAKGLAKLPGVGKKTAERILLDLADKLPDLGPPAAAPSVALPEGGSIVERDLLSALMNLGYRDTVAAEAAKRSIGRLGEEAGLEALLRDALTVRR